jgi:hypothetical protein
LELRGGTQIQSIHLKRREGLDIPPVLESNRRKTTTATHPHRPDVD